MENQDDKTTNIHVNDNSIYKTKRQNRFTWTQVLSLFEIFYFHLKAKPSSLIYFLSKLNLTAGK